MSQNYCFKFKSIIFSNYWFYDWCEHLPLYWSETYGVLQSIAVCADYMHYMKRIHNEEWGCCSQCFIFFMSFHFYALENVCMETNACGLGQWHLFVLGTPRSKWASVVFPGGKKTVYKLLFSITYSQMEVYAFLLNILKHWWVAYDKFYIWVLILMFN